MERLDFFTLVVLPTLYLLTEPLEVKPEDSTVRANTQTNNQTCLTSAEILTLELPFLAFKGLLTADPRGHTFSDE